MSFILLFTRNPDHMFSVSRAPSSRKKQLRISRTVVGLSKKLLKYPGTGENANIHSQNMLS